MRSARTSARILAGPCKKPMIALIQKFKEPEKFAEWVQEIDSDHENQDEEEEDDN